PAAGRSLCGALHTARVHQSLPAYRSTRLRASGDRLCAGRLAGRIEIAETLSGQLPQSRRLSRGLHRGHRQTSGRDAGAAMAADRRLLVSPWRHADRRVLADRSRAGRAVAARSGRAGLSRARLRMLRLGKAIAGRIAARHGTIPVLGDYTAPESRKTIET